MSKRGTSNSNSRGSAADRLARKLWLLATFSPKLGPTEAWCEFNCGTIVTLKTISVDRYPIPGCEGGSYRRDNIRPSCSGCNSRHGSELARRAKRSSLAA